MSSHRPDAHDADIEELRLQLVERVTAHPPSTWSSSLLSVIINAINLQFPDTGPLGAEHPTGRPELYIVRPTSASQEEATT